jgi:hypothetical protein
MMEVKDEEQAAAYLKLQDDVKQLIVDTIYKELMNYGSPLHTHISASILHSQNFKDQVKNVIKDQMNKY